MLSLIIAGVTAWPAIVLFRPATMSLMGALQVEQTHFYVLSFGGFSLSGWQMVAFEAMLILVALAFVAAAVYAFVFGEDNA